MASANSSKSMFPLVFLFAVIIAGGSFFAWRTYYPPAGVSGETPTTQSADPMKAYQRLCAAKAAAGEGRHEEALAMFEEIVKAGDEGGYRWDADIQAGFELSALGRHAEALSRLERIIREVPDEHDSLLAQLARADALNQAGQHDAALTLFADMINRERERQTWLCGEAIVGITRVYEKKGQLGRVRGTLSRLVFDYPGAEETRQRAALANITQLDERVAKLQAPEAGKWPGRKIDRLGAGENTWAAADGPYLVTAPLVIGNADTLRIEAGTQVRFLATAKIEVRGHLVAGGNEEKPIQFLPLSDERGHDFWRGIQVTGKNGRVELTHCRIAGADTGLSLENGRAELMHCTLEYCGRAAVYAERSADVAMTQCIIKDTDRAGIECQGRTSLKLINCQVTGAATQGLLITRAAGAATIKQTSVQQCGEDGVSLQGDLNAVMEQCQIAQNGGHGITARDGSKLALSRSRVSNNARAGIKLQDRCQVTINACELIGNRGIGFVAEARCTGELMGNRIADNEGSGLVLSMDSAPAVRSNQIDHNRGPGIILRDTTPKLDSNLITDNAEAGLRNEGKTRVMATNNWWGSADEAAVTRQIQSQNDKPEWGEVEYRPWLTEAPKWELGPIGTTNPA